MRHHRLIARTQVSKPGQPATEFYNQRAYEDWKRARARSAGGLSGWKIKYYKGLGTSDAMEARGYFRSMKRQAYVHNGAASDEAIDLAFNKKRADARKAWLGRYDGERVLDADAPRVTYGEFVDRELIHFSKYDLERSIPNVVDGLKTSQRKILYACFKRKLVRDEIRVAQLAGYVSEHAAYHHGEASLQGAIIAMAQRFVGSNNLPLLQANGQFGTRIMGGKDAASPRYIHTLLSPLATRVFAPEDESVLRRLEDDGQPVEPVHYAPLIPMALVNGAVGIGTAFSTSIPAFRPTALVDYLLAMPALTAGATPATRSPRLVPWYAGFKGTIRERDGGWESLGVVERGSGADTLRITELPVGTWTEEYVEALNAWADERPKLIRSVMPQYTESDAVFDIKFQRGMLTDEWLTPDKDGLTRAHRELRLVSNKGLGTRNMHLFDEAGAIQRYDSAEAVVEAFAGVRLRTYALRRSAQMRVLRDDMELLQARIKFIKLVVDGKVQVVKVKQATLVGKLESNGLPRREGSYDYLLGMPISSLTAEKITELEARVRAAEGEVKALEGTTPARMWAGDLRALRPALASMEAGSGSDADGKKAATKDDAKKRGGGSSTKVASGLKRSRGHTATDSKTDSPSTVKKGKAKN